MFAVEVYLMVSEERYLLLFLSISANCNRVVLFVDKMLTCHVYIITNDCVCCLFISRMMSKADICICENKDTDQLCSNCTTDQCLFFTTRKVQSLFFINPKFGASSLLL